MASENGIQESSGPCCACWKMAGLACFVFLIVILFGVVLFKILI